MPIVQRAGQSVNGFVNYINRMFRKRHTRKDSRKFRTFERKTKKQWLKNGLRKELRDLICHDVQNGNDKQYSWNKMVEAAQDSEFLYNLKHPPNVPCLSSSVLEDFKVSYDGYVKIYTDGSCQRNGQTNAKAGIGVYFGPGSELNTSEPLRSDLEATSTNAEIAAAIKALDIAKRHEACWVRIYTDSKDLCKTMTQHVFKWLRNGWTRSNGDQVKHREIYRELLELMTDMNVKWEHVDAHGDDDWNIAADRLARKGAKLYNEEDDDD